MLVECTMCGGRGYTTTERGSCPGCGGAGKVRMEGATPKPKKRRKWIGTPPKECDFCHKAIQGVFIDGRTIHGMWAIMCPPCHGSQGVGLGMGVGQKFQKEEDEFYKVEG